MFTLPPITEAPEGGERKAGFEIEYTGLRPRDAAALVIELFGGELKEIDEYEVRIEGSRLGNFSIYIDSVYLRASNRNYLFRDADLLKELIYSLSELVVPYEIVTPPIPFSQLDEVEQLRQKLKEHGALGTRASILYAFGMHINIQTYTYEAEGLRDLLRAFVLMQEWIKEVIDVDLTRKLSWFIEPFDDEYIELICRREYNPTLAELIDDYLLYNPTRNRALDMLPLFTFLDPKVKERLPEQKISPRPAFHYRLPNSRIDEEEWSVAKEFNIWTLVEKGALNREALRELADDYLEFMASPYWFIRELWIERVDEWVKEL
ncbi:MAG: amidoligase enzyme [Epsilonproteobacteria bacterium]|nr:amidoligase enzyme [Campylobacterota bacterium]NPA56097.1 amidoligase enzyme [Campylobacterota bacterium]